MNWIFSLFFWISMFVLYNLVGNMILNIFNYKDNNKYATRIISGFLFVYAIAFLIGFPMQLLSLNWNLFFYVLLVTYIALLVSLIFYYRTRFTNFNKNNIKGLLHNHFKEYWFLYLLVIIFTVLSMANQEAFLYMNYDDHYYIGKILNNINASALGNENYYNGSLLESTGISIERVVNCYEITYGFFSVLFNIDVPFFCRGTMVVHNYYLVFLVFKTICELFIDKKYSQYALFPFVLYFVSHGYLMEYMPFGLTIKSFDGWQFQSAIFYGSSVVRTMSLPVLLIFGKDLIKKFDLKNFLFIVIVSCAFISFSTIYFQMVVTVFILFLIVKLLYYAYDNFNDKKKFVFSILVLLIGCFAFIVLCKIDASIILNDETILSYTTNFPAYSDYYIRYDKLMMMAPFIFIILFFLSKNNENKFLLILVAGLYTILRLNYFSNYLMLTSIGFVFVTLRTVASMQYLILLFIGIIIIFIISKFKISLLLTCCLSILAVVTSLSYVYIFYDDIRSCAYLGSGMVEEGYDFNRIFTNDKMIPEIVDEVGEYFDTLPTGNYKLYVQALVPYEETVIDAANFNVSSSNIEICVRGACNNVQEEQSIIDVALNNERDFSTINSILQKYNIEYILMTNKYLVESAIELGNDVVLVYEDNYYAYFLIKIK